MSKLARVKWVISHRRFYPLQIAIFKKKNSLPKIRLCNLYAKQSGLVAIMALETVGACLLILKLTLRDPVFLTIRLMSSSSKNLIVFYCRLLNTGLFSKADRL